MTTGKIQTVLGDISPSELGYTLAHEHLLITFNRWRVEAGTATPRVHTDPRATQPISLETIGWGRRYGHPQLGNLTDEALAIQEVTRFKTAGGGAIVDSTNVDLKRDPEALVRISRASGLHVIMGTGHYVGSNHPFDMDSRTQEDLTREIVHDVTVGADGTGIKSGVIGEVGHDWPMNANEEKALRAAAVAQRITGAPLQVHPGRNEASPMASIEIVRDAGGDPGRTIMSHIDRTLFKRPDMVALARTGCYIEFDLFGQESSYYSPSPIDMPNDAMRLEHIRHLIAEGLGDRVVVAHDICNKRALCAFGGEGYAHISENVVPIMRRKGMTEREIEMIFVDNPARVLTFVEPAPVAGVTAAKLLAER